MSDVKRYDVYVNINTGIDDVDYLIASFYKKDAVEDYIDLLNHAINDDLFVIYHYEEVDLV